MHQPSRILAVSIAAYLGFIAAASAEQSAGLTGTATIYTVARGDTWRTLASKFGVDPSTLAADNHAVVSHPLTAGQRIHVDNRHIVPPGVEAGAITVNVAQRMLFFRDESELSAYPIAVGKGGWQTPPASFTVVEKQENPTWHVPASILAESEREGKSLPAVVPPGPKNPLGQYWLGLSLSGFGIHGTPFPSSIYQNVTHGCIRLQSDNIASLFSRVELGTPGRIIYEPILLTAQGDDVFMEVHTDVYHRLAGPPMQIARELAANLGLTDRVDWTLAEREINSQAGVARKVTRGTSTAE